MPNNAYQRSVRREREVVNDLRANGYYCARSAGSKSPWDVYAVHPVTGDVRLIQIKTHKSSRVHVFKQLKTYQGTIGEYLYTY